MSETPTERAAGGLVYRHVNDPIDGPIEVLLAHRPRYDDWTFPKGKQDQGESLIECALREVKEESGLRCRAGRYLGTTRYGRSGGGSKQVSYWAMEAVGGTFEPNDEVDAVSWVLPAELPRRLSYAVDVEFQTNLEESWAGPASRILLTRHAHAGDRFRWTGDDTQRPLSSQGYLEAERITDQLASFAIDRALTSMALRCTETIAPTLASRNMTYEIRDDLWEETPYEEVANLAHIARVGTTLLCTHGPIVASALHALTGRSVGVPMEKASTWVLDFIDDSLAAANYIAPPIA